jgi:hypothetical protein
MIRPFSPRDLRRLISMSPITSELFRDEDFVFSSEMSAPNLRMLRELSSDSETSSENNLDV